MRALGQSMKLLAPFLFGAGTLAGSLTADSQAYAGFQLNNLTTTQRDALAVAPATGAVIWNTTTGAMEAYNGVSWESADAFSGGTITGAITFSGTTHAGIALNNLTTTQRDAIASPATGSLIWNTTTSAVNAYTSATWIAIAPLVSPSFTTPALGVASATSVTASGLLQAGTTIGISTDVLLARDAAATLAQRNGTTAQIFYVYNTYATAGVDFERARIAWLSNNLVIGNEKGGTGAGRTLILQSTGSIAIKTFDANSYGWDFDSSGHFMAHVDNTFDIGASGATRPRALYIAGLGTFGGLLTSAGLTTSVNTTYTAASQGPVLKQGANGRVGTFVANGVTAVTVSNTSIAISDAIIISLNAVGGVVGALPAIQTITASTGFTVAATAADTSTYNYTIIKNAA